MRSLLLVVVLCACGGGSDDDDAGMIDSGGSDFDAGKLEDAGPDGGASPDSGGSDAGMSDAGSQPDAGPGACDAMDAMEGTPCGPTERPGTAYLWDGNACTDVHWCRCVGADCDARFTTLEDCEDAYAGCLGATCATDSDCPSGEEWCDDGRCVECDNSGLVCRIACPDGWSTYMRNGCNPCDCAPDNECTGDRMCGALNRCYPGAFCWDWCPAGDPSCCFGNVCGAPGCSEPSPVGCSVRGCPLDQTCDRSMCESSSCTCSDGDWACTDDCAGGVCVPLET